MTGFAAYNGRIPIDPRAVAIVAGLCALYSLIQLLTPDQRESLALLAELVGILLALARGRR
jgi:type III secretory pathway component EscS